MKLFKNDILAQKAIQHLVRVCTVDEAAPRFIVEGAKFGWTMSFETRFWFQVLISAGEIEYEDTVALQAISDLAENSRRHSLEDFKNAYRARLIKQQQSAAKPSLWRVLLPMAVDPDQSFGGSGEITAFGFKYLWRTWRQAVNDIPEEKIIDEFKRAGRTARLPDITHVFVVETNGTSLESAYKSISTSFASLRGAIELVLGNGRVKIGFPFRAVHEIPHPSCIFGWQPDISKLGYVHFRADPGDLLMRRLPKLSNDIFHTIKDLIENEIGCSEGKMDTRNIVADALRLYCQATDDDNIYFYLLSLWQMAETLTLSGRHQGKGQITVRRLAEVFSRETKLDRDGLHCILERILRMRSVIVHKGDDPGLTDEECIFLLVTVTACLDWLITRLPELPTQEHLEQYFAMVAKRPVELKAAQDVLHVLNGPP